MTFSKTNTSIEKMIWNVIAQTATARAIVRKAGLPAGEALSDYADIWGTFSRINDADGYSLSYASGDTSFPEDTDSMLRYSDMSNTTEARLLVNIAVAGVSGALLSVESNALPTSPSVSIASAGLFYSEWRPMDSSGSTTLTWVVSSPSGGTATLGLCQLQVR